LAWDFAMFGHRLEGSLDIYRQADVDILTVTNPLALPAREPNRS